VLVVLEILSKPEIFKPPEFHLNANSVSLSINVFRCPLTVSRIQSDDEHECDKDCGELRLQCLCDSVGIRIFRLVWNGLMPLCLYRVS
jgi:hypothetical protein